MLDHKVVSCRTDNWELCFTQRRRKRLINFAITEPVCVSLSIKKCAHISTIQVKLIEIMINENCVHFMRIFSNDKSLRFEALTDVIWKPQMFALLHSIAIM